ncbi:MAG: endolytic transglycosylase MltG [Firmicutes bacterium]|nr:endolytic transglycosylase MltG [Bacillota bacterium]
MPKIKPVPFFLSVILLLCITLFFISFLRVRPIVTKEIEIPLGSSTAHIASILQEEGLIQNAFLFQLLAKYKGYDKKLQAGRYQLNSNMSLEEILLELQTGIVKKEGIRFTIPEGFTVEQIAARMEEYQLVTKEDFLNFCRGEGSAAQLLQNVGEIPPQVRFRCEGYLFPDTYEVHADATAEEIVEMMLARFFEVFDEEYRLQAEKIGFSIHQIVTIASLIEKEAALPEERPLISAVFHNRLNSEASPFLQSCATVQYILGENKPVLTYQDLEIDSPFNTYLYPNLPPGPIASPGRQALQAALYPADADYMYFVSKEDGSGGHYFSRTLQEHNHFKSIAQQNRR